MAGATEKPSVISERSNRQRQQPRLSKIQLWAANKPEVNGQAKPGLWKMQIWSVGSRLHLQTFPVDFFPPQPRLLLRKKNSCVAALAETEVALRCCLGSADKQ